ncbi:MAG: OmpA family protein [Porphyromonadaceae bacterium]|nr:OmpA family protein [Porphyromonadaceae bacterium]
MNVRITYILLAFAFFSVSCDQAKLSDARSQYLRGEYHAASETYRKLYRSTPREELSMRGVIAFEMAENYRALNQPARAVVAYDNAIRSGYPDTTMYLSFARMLHRERKYPQALDAYRSFLLMQPGHPLALNGIQGVVMAQQEQPSRYAVQRMNLFNSAQSEFSPLLARRDHLIYFTSSRDEAAGETKSPVTGMKYNDLFFSEKDVNGAWKKPKRLPDEINTGYDEGTPSITRDGEWMYYTFSGTGPNGSDGTSIYYSKRVNGAWRAGRPLQILKDDTLSLFAHPTISPSGRYLYFVSDMPGGQGGKDIWRVSVSSDHITGIPQNLGASVNSAGNEMFPYMRDDSTLYFSSDGLPGRGGLDLFKAIKRQQTNDWHVSSLPVPLNSPADDFGITFMQDAEQGFFSSNRDDARGYDHIYSFVYREPTLIVTGFAVDQEDEFIPGARVSVTGSDGSQQRFITNLKGEYQFKATGGIEYLFTASAEGFLDEKKSLRTTSEEKDTLYYVDFEMVPYNKPVVLEHIFYDFDRATLRPESKRELDKLITILREHPEISIEITAHTDRKGSEDYNLNLSTKRAQAVADYLTEYGIGQNRVTAEGRGKTEPKYVSKNLADKFVFLKEGDRLSEEFIEQLPPQQQPVADQLNRRTEFRVVEPTFFTL